MHWSGRLGSRLGYGAAYTGLVPWLKKRGRAEHVCLVHPPHREARRCPMEGVTRVIRALPPFRSRPSFPDRRRAAMAEDDSEMKVRALPSRRQHWILAPCDARSLPLAGGHSEDSEGARR